MPKSFTSEDLECHSECSDDLFDDDPTEEAQIQIELESLREIHNKLLQDMLSDQGKCRTLFMTLKDNHSIEHWQEYTLIFTDLSLKHERVQALSRRINELENPAGINQPTTERSTQLVLPSQPFAQNRPVITETQASASIKRFRVSIRELL